MPEPERSLWEQFDSDVEPWRRGRLALVWIALVNLASQAFIFVLGIIAGATEYLFWLATGSILFWLQFYFIWIGVHWIRWVAGAWSGLCGFAYVIWGLRDGNELQIAFGCINIVIGVYLGLSPSVYFFAKHQQEKRNWLHSLAIAGIFLLLFFTLLLGSMGLAGYRARLETQAREFADEAFTRIFAEHDTYYFLDRMTERGLAASGGRGGATKFLVYTESNTGKVHGIKAATTQVRIKYQFPMDISAVGIAVSEAVGAHGSLQLRIEIEQDAGGGWKFNSIFWHYLDPNFRKQ